MAQLIIKLPDDRTTVGTIELIDNEGKTAFSAPALGMADSTKAKAEGNPSRDPKLPYGHTPSGEYSVTGFRPTGPGHNHGPHGKIELNPISGVALTAKNNGRTHLQIDPPPLKWSAAMFRKRRIRDGKQATQARGNSHEVRLITAMYVKAYVKRGKLTPSTQKQSARLSRAPQCAL